MRWDLLSSRHDRTGHDMSPFKVICYEINRWVSNLDKSNVLSETKSVYGGQSIQCTELSTLWNECDFEWGAINHARLTPCLDTIQTIHKLTLSAKLFSSNRNSNKTYFSVGIFLQSLTKLKPLSKLFHSSFANHPSKNADPPLISNFGNGSVCRVTLNFYFLSQSRSRLARKEGNAYNLDQL